MPLNRRLTLSIVVIFSGLLLFWLLLQGVQQQPVKDVAATMGVLQLTATAIPPVGYIFPDVQPGNVTKITVRESQTGKSITLLKVPGDWQATNESGTPIPLSTESLANLSRVVQIIGILPYNRVIIDQTNVATYGLAGDARLTVQFEAGTTHRLKIGTIAQVSGLTYVMRDDDSTIYLVPTKTLEFLSGLLAGAPP